MGDIPSRIKKPLGLMPGLPSIWYIPKRFARLKCPPQEKLLAIQGVFEYCTSSEKWFWSGGFWKAQKVLHLTCLLSITFYIIELIGKKLKTNGAWWTRCNVTEGCRVTLSEETSDIRHIIGQTKDLSLQVVCTRIVNLSWNHFPWVT